MQEDITEKLQNFVNYLRSSINCQCPAQIKKVNEDGTVNILVFRNDSIENQLLVGIKIKHLESGRAFIHLGVSEGDYGVVRYFDTSINDYIDGETAYNFDDRQHNSNDGCFELGFIPNPSTYIFPPGEITIGSKTGSALISIDNEIIKISGGNVQISGATVNIGEQTIIDGKVFLEHQHSNGNQGANTGGVV